MRFKQFVLSEMSVKTHNEQHDLFEKFKKTPAYPVLNSLEWLLKDLVNSKHKSFKEYDEYAEKEYDKKASSLGATKYKKEIYKAFRANVERFGMDLIFSDDYSSVSHAMIEKTDHDSRYIYESRLTNIIKGVCAYLFDSALENFSAGGEGSSRQVFVYKDEFVIKVATNDAGLSQNTHEFEYSIEQYQKWGEKSILPEVAYAISLDDILFDKEYDENFRRKYRTISQGSGEEILLFVTEFLKTGGEFDQHDYHYGEDNGARDNSDYHKELKKDGKIVTHDTSLDFMLNESPYESVIPKVKLDDGKIASPLTHNYVHGSLPHFKNFVAAVPSHNDSYHEAIDSLRDKFSNADEVRNYVQSDVEELFDIVEKFKPMYSTEFWKLFVEGYKILFHDEQMGYENGHSPKINVKFGTFGWYPQCYIAGFIKDLGPEQEIDSLDSITEEVVLVIHSDHDTQNRIYVATKTKLYVYKNDDGSEGDDINRLLPEGLRYQTYHEYGGNDTPLALLRPKATYYFNKKLAEEITQWFIHWYTEFLNLMSDEAAADELGFAALMILFPQVGDSIQGDMAVWQRMVKSMLMDQTNMMDAQVGLSGWGNIFTSLYQEIKKTIRGLGDLQNSSLFVHLRSNRDKLVSDKMNEALLPWIFYSLSTHKDSKKKIIEKMTTYIAKILQVTELKNDKNLHMGDIHRDEQWGSTNNGDVKIADYGLTEDPHDKKSKSRLGNNWNKYYNGTQYIQDSGYDGSNYHGGGSEEPERHSTFPF